MPRGGKVTLDHGGIRSDANRASATEVRRIARRVLARSGILCPVDTGNLRASGVMKYSMGRRGPTGTVEYPVKYATAVHDGSGPHIIKARRKKALKFEMNGRTVYARSVKHPGTEGRPFLQTAADEVARGEGVQFKKKNLSG